MSTADELERKIKALKAMKMKTGGDAPVGTKDDAISGEEIRQDMSEKVKDLIKELSKEGDYRFGVFVGNAGGKRKIIQCPHCQEKMVVAGIKSTRAKSERVPTQGQKDWMEFVKLVGEMPSNAGTGRKKHMKMASELKKQGITLEDLKSL